MTNDRAVGKMIMAILCLIHFLGIYVIMICESQ